MRKYIIFMVVMAFLELYPYGHPAHQKITAKLPDILRDHGFESAAHFIWDAVYNDPNMYPQLHDPIIYTNLLQNWENPPFNDTDIVPVYRTQVADIDWNLWDLFPWELSQDLLAAIADIAFSIKDYKKGDTLKFWTSKKGAFPCLYDDVHMADSSNYEDAAYSKNLTGSAVWPDFRTFFDNDPDTIYRGNDILNHTYIRVVTTGTHIAGHADIRLNQCFDFAVQYWNDGDTVQALRWLGRGLHFIQDVSVPFHSSLPWWAFKGSGAGMLFYLMWESWHQQDKFDNFADSIPFNDWQYYGGFSGWDTSYVNDDTIEPGQIIKDVSDFARKHFSYCDGINPEFWNVYSWNTEPDNIPYAVSMSMHMAFKACAEYIMKFFKTVGYIESPTDLSASNITETSVTLSWKDNSDNEDTFKIYISTDGTNFTLNKALSANTTTSVIEGLTLGTDYWFKVEAVNNQGTKSFYNPVIFAPTLWFNPPTNLQSTLLSFYSAHLTWVDNSQYNTGYEISYPTQGGDTTITVGDINSCTINNLRPFSLDFVRVRAMDNLGHYSDRANIAIQDFDLRDFYVRPDTSEVHANRLDLSWTHGAFHNYLIVRGDADVEWTPTDGVDYNVGDIVGNNYVVVHKGVEDTFTDTGLVLYHTYYYHIYCVDPLLNYSPGLGGLGTPVPMMYPDTLAGLLFNNGEKIIWDGDSLLLTYFANGDIHLATSRDGENWNDSIINYGGIYPSICASNSDIGVIFYYDYDIGIWFSYSGASGFMSTNYSTGVHPSIWALNDTAHYSFEMRGSDYDKICYGYIPLQPFGENMIYEKVDSIDGSSLEYNRFYYPSITLDNLGRPHIIVQQGWRQNPKIIDYWKDNGYWHLDTLVEGARFPATYSDGNKIYLVFSEDHYEEGIYFMEYEPSSGWSSLDTVYSDPEITGINVFPDVVVDNNGYIYVGFSDYQVADTSFDIYLTERINGEWAEPVNITKNAKTSKFPAMAITDTFIYLAYMERTDQDADWVLKTKKISRIPEVAINSPVSNTNLESGYDYSIIWHSKDNIKVEYHNIYYSLDDGLSWVPIAEYITDTTYNWRTPEVVVNNALLRVDAVDGEGNVGSDTVSVNIGQFTSNGNALSYSNQRKMAVYNDVVHWVYTDGDSVFYAYFDGNYHKREFVGFGKNPAIAVDENGIFAVWVSSDASDLVYRYKTTLWSIPDTIISTSNDTVISPCIYSRGNNIYITADITGRARRPEGEFSFYEVRYYEFPYNQPTTTYKQIAEYRSLYVDVASQGGSSSLTLDEDGNPHIVWTNPFWSDTEEVYYKYRKNGVWSTAENLSNSPDIRSIHPFIDYDKGVINVVWKEGDNIVRRRKWVKGDWESVEQIFGVGGPPISDYIPPTIENPKSPQIKGGSKCVYQATYGNVERIFLQRWDKLIWKTPETIDNGVLPQTALSGNKLSILYLKPAGSEYKLTLTQTTETFPWGKTDDTLATAPNNQKKIILRNNQLHTVYDGYGKIYYRYTNNAECGIQNAEVTDNAEWSEDITIGEGIHPAIASGDVVSFIYLSLDSALKYRYVSDTISSEYTIHTNITGAPAITGRGDSIFITAPVDTGILLLSMLYNATGITEDLFIKGEHPSLAKDITGKIHLAYQRNDTIYYKEWGETSTYIDTGRNPSLNAVDIIDISYQKGDSVYRVIKGLYGEEYDRGSIDIGQNPQGFGYISAYNSDGGVMWQRWDGTGWTDGSRILGTNPQITIEPTQTSYTLDIFSYNNIDRVEINQFGNIPYPERIPHLFATDSFSSGLNNGNRLIPIGDTLYLAYTSGGNIYLTYSEDKGRGWHWPVLIDKGKYPAMATDGENLYITYLQDYLPNSGYNIKLAGYNANLIPIWDSTKYLVCSMPERQFDDMDYDYGGPPSIAAGRDSIFILWKQVGRKPMTLPPAYSYFYERLMYRSTEKTTPYFKLWFKGLDEVRKYELPHLLEPTSPSICVDTLDNPYFTWAPFSEGLYFYDSTFVRDTVDTGYIKHPHLDWHNSYLSFVWTKDDTIIKRDRVYDGPVALSTPPPSEDTTIAGGDEAVVRSSHLLWKTTTGDIQYLYDIFGNYDTTIVQTPALSGYPQEAVIGDTLIYVWTEGNGPYYILSGRMKLNDINYVYIEDLGKKKPSPFTVYRDTFISFCSEYYNTMDAGQDSLVYQFPHLNPNKWYRLRLYFYQESGDTVPWSEMVSMDMGNFRFVIIPDDSIVVIDKLIPKGFYRMDSTIRIKIRKITGDYAILSAFILYQVEKPMTGGPQIAGGRNIPLITKFRGIYPNPFSKVAIISYSVSAESGRRIVVSAKIYDVLGRIRQTLIDKEQSPGYYRITFKPDKYPTGVYFLRFQAGEYKKTEKMVIVK